jgi:hypothetical protein
MLNGGEGIWKGHVILTAIFLRPVLTLVAGSKCLNQRAMKKDSW